MKYFALILAISALLTGCNLKEKTADVVNTAVETKDKVVETAGDIKTATKEVKEAVDSVKEISE